ncbi:MAG: bifunctional 4-hydroxy-2-oxoglutarate aldolase/2-dehydro-3-deoxy-phosphogluconate aldolase [Candidatus Competibacterales bacterium]
MDLDALLSRGLVIPVLTLDDPDRAAPLAEALVAGGVTVLEVTLRTPKALEVMAAMARVAGAVVGVGTVTRPEQFQQAKDAGAQFAVTPGSTLELLKAALDSGLPTLPGVMTPSEAMAAQIAGFTRLKLFPAEAAGGVALLKALASPLPELQFCPTGGVGPHNFRDYLALPNVVCVGGSWLAPGDVVAASDWGRITDLARQATAPGT